MNFVYGASRSALEETNYKGCYENPRYELALKTYHIILDKANEFIKQHAPVTALIISRYNYNLAKAEFYSEDRTIYCLSFVYIPRNDIIFSYKHRTVAAYRMTNELAYILRSEGWLQETVDINDKFFQLKLRHYNENA